MDGAMGTLLAQALPPTASVELAVLEHADRVLKFHTEYIQAGARIIQTHTFGANPYRLKQEGAEKRFENLNHQAVKLARTAREMLDKPIWIGGSIGPILSPLPEDLEGYAQQAQILEGAGCDLLILETFPSLELLKEALRRVKAVTRLPIFAEISLPDEWSPPPEGTHRTLLEALEALPALVVGINCGTGPEEYWEWVHDEGFQPKRPFSMLPNAGIPIRKNGRIYYPPSSPEYFASFAKEMAQAGVRCLGGCCGTTPDHIHAMAKVLKTIIPKKRQQISPPVKAVEKPEKVTPTSTFFQALTKGFTTVVQLDPPKGTSLDHLVQVAQAVRDSGKVTAVDVNANPLGRLHFDALFCSLFIQQKVGIETIPHVTPRDASIMGLESALLGAWYGGIRNLLIITGDPSQLGDYPSRYDVYQTDSVGLVEILKKLNEGYDWLGNPVGSPPSFVLGVAVNPGAEDIEKERVRFQAKVERGAQFAMSQVIYHWEVWERFWEPWGSPPIPVLVGIWPLTSFRLALRIHYEIPGITIPLNLLEKLEKAGKDAGKIGWEVAYQLYDQAPHFAQGAYLIAPFKKGEKILDLLT